MQKDLKRKMRLEKKRKRREDKEAEKIAELEKLTRPDTLTNNKENSK